MYIDKQIKAWSPLVSVPDSDDQQQKWGTKKGKCKRKGRVRVQLFEGSEEPLVLARKIQRQHTKRRYHAHTDWSPSTSASAAASFVARFTYARNGECRCRCGGVVVDEWVWPGVYAVVSLRVGVVTVAADAGPVGKRKILHMIGGSTAMTTSSRAILGITQEEVERAIGAAFAVSGW
jgi:hypothetical protein